MTRIQRFHVAAFAALLAACSDPQALPPLEVAEIVVAPDDRVLAAGDTMRLTAWPMTQSGLVLGSIEVTWRSENDSVAGVNRRGPHAVVDARRPGTTRIIAEAEGRSGHVTVVVLAEAPPVVRLEIVPGGGQIPLSGNQRLEALLIAEDGSVIGGLPVQWSSSSPQRLTVTSVGNPAIAVLVPHAGGEVVITAQSGGVAGSATFMVGAGGPTADH